MKHEPRNASIYLPDLQREAELYFQTAFCDHILQNYRGDGQKKRYRPQEIYHDLTFADIKHTLPGNALIEINNKRSRKYKVLNTFLGKLYRGFFYLR